MAFGLKELPSEVPYQRPDGRALDLPDHLKRIEIKQICAKLCDRKLASSFQMADILHWVESHESPEGYDTLLHTLVEKLGYKRRTFYNVQSVGRTFPPNERQHTVTWHHYDVIRRKKLSKEQRHDLLARDERENWTDKRLRNEIENTLREAKSCGTRIDRLEELLSEMQEAAAEYDELHPILKRLSATLNRMRETRS
ncbi:MAG TPA: hypothetical protein VKT27_10435 [Candidatus Binataceae bacterium]|nr:hypothetical protein [Candidatus Binataceae bacterium]